MNKKYFFEYRKAALLDWINLMNIFVEENNPVVWGENDSYSRECTWQHRQDKLGFHNSLFCGFRLFAANIKDLLEDPRCDEISDLDIIEFGKDTMAGNQLFRYYCRILLVTEVLIDEFNSVLKKSDSQYKKGNKLKGFINSIFKHKTKDLHFYKKNHHAYYLFEDWKYDALKLECDAILTIENYGVYKNAKKEMNIDAIQVPSLTDILSVIFSLYHDFEEALNNIESFREMIYKEYNQAHEDVGTE